MCKKLYKDECVSVCFIESAIYDWLCTVQKVYCYSNFYDCKIIYNPFTTIEYGCDVHLSCINQRECILLSDVLRMSLITMEFKGRSKKWNNKPPVEGLSTTAI